MQDNAQTGLEELLKCYERDEMKSVYFSIFVVLMLCIGCSYKASTKLSVQSENEKYGNQTIEIERNTEASK